MASTEWPSCGAIREIFRFWPLSAEPLAPSLIRVVFSCFSRDSALLQSIGRFRQPLCGLTRGLHSPPNSGGGSNEFTYAKPPPPGSLGKLKWDGAAGCYMVIDRKQDMFFVVLEQMPTERQRVQRTLKQLVYEAMEN